MTPYGARCRKIDEEQKEAGGEKAGIVGIDQDARG